MKLFTSEQIRNWDKLSIEKDWGSSMQLMDHAAEVFYKWTIENFPDTSTTFIVLAGPGNNGGDAIVIARMLKLSGKKCKLLRFGKAANKFSEDNSRQFELLKGLENPPPTSEFFEGDPLPDIDSHAVIIDGLFGSGLNKPLEGWWAELVRHINRSGNPVLSIDIPSGMPSEGSVRGPIVTAYRTLSFEVPKLSFFYPEIGGETGNWEFRSIGLSKAFLNTEATDYHYIDNELVSRLIVRRRKFTHKGTYGHALLIAGSAGKMGAAILAARAALRSGLGLLTVHLPCRGEMIMQTAVPEAMIRIDPHEYHWSTPLEKAPYDVLGIGSGIGTPDITQKALLDQLDQTKVPVVLDADALNILAITGMDLERLPPGSVLTPHPGEFKRLFGDFPDTPSKWSFMLRESQRISSTIVLKGAHTAISTPDGNLFINSTGNPGMATAGSGDTLTGIITSLIAQGYPGDKAAIAGVYWHGLAGDLSANDYGYESMIASDIIDNLGPALKRILYQNT